MFDAVFSSETDISGKCLNAKPVENTHFMKQRHLPEIVSHLRVSDSVCLSNIFINEFLTPKAAFRQQNCARCCIALHFSTREENTGISDK